MHQFQKTTPRIRLGQMASPALYQQTRNHQSLGEQNGRDRDYLPAVLVPESWGAKAYLAVLWQPALIDTKPLELAPVEHRPSETAPSVWDLRRLLATENTQHEVSRIRTDQARADNKTSGTAVSNRGLCIDDNGSGRRFGDSLERFVRMVDDPGAVGIDRRIDDCSVLGQHSHAIQQVRHRQSQQVDDLESCRSGRDFLLEMAPYGLAFEGIAHQRDPLQIR